MREGAQAAVYLHHVVQKLHHIHATLGSFAVVKLGPVVATNWVYFNPITTILFAWWLLNEKITIWFLLGSALILLGMYLADKQKA